MASSQRASRLMALASLIAKIHAHWTSTDSCDSEPHHHHHPSSWTWTNSGNPCIPTASVTWAVTTLPPPPPPLTITTSVWPKNTNPACANVNIQALEPIPTADATLSSLVLSYEQTAAFATDLCSVTTALPASLLPAYSSFGSSAWDWMAAHTSFRPIFDACPDAFDDLGAQGLKDLSNALIAGYCYSSGLAATVTPDTSDTGVGATGTSGTGAWSTGVSTWTSTWTSTETGAGGVPTGTVTGTITGTSTSSVRVTSTSSVVTGTVSHSGAGGRERVAEGVALMVGLVLGVVAVV